MGDFTPVQKISDLIKANNYTMMNSLKFNEVDWTIVVKKAKDETQVKKVEEEAAQTVSEEA